MRRAWLVLPRRYIVLNRPYAFVQWCNKAKIPERYVFMSEPDHIMIRPLPNFMKGETPGEPASKAHPASLMPCWSVCMCVCLRIPP